MTRRFVLFAALWMVLASGCRSVVPVAQIHTATAPDISRVTLKNGNLVVFDADLGWYDREKGIVEGTTADSQHVTYHLSEISKVEVVRVYSIIFAALAAMAPLGLGIYVLAKLLTLV